MTETKIRAAISIFRILREISVNSTFTINSQKATIKVVEIHWETTQEIVP